MVIWIGQQVSGEMIAKLFGVTSQAQIDMDMVIKHTCLLSLLAIKLVLVIKWMTFVPQHSLPALDNTLSFRVRGIIDQLQAASQLCMKV